MCKNLFYLVLIFLSLCFQGELRNSWKAYMRVETRKLSGPGDRVKAPTKQFIVDWLVAAWSYIEGKPELVVRSFKACGISNKLGGSKDSLVRCMPETEGACDSDDDTDELDYNDDDDTMSMC